MEVLTLHFVNNGGFHEIKFEINFGPKNERPHCEVLEHNEVVAVIWLDSLTFESNKLSPAISKKVLAWASRQHEELLEAYKKARR